MDKRANSLKTGDTIAHKSKHYLVLEVLNKNTATVLRVRAIFTGEEDVFVSHNSQRYDIAMSEDIY